MHTFQGRILGKFESTEKSWRLEVFAPALGGIVAHLRKPGKRSPTFATPDLFDEVTLSTEEGARTHHHFVRECRIDHRLSALSKSYSALREATAFGRTIWRNLDHIETFAPLYALLSESLDAFDEGHRPEVAHFKSLYLFGRLEGYPMKEDMLASWNELDRKIGLQMLKEPLDGDQPPLEESTRLLDRQRDYLRQYTDILVAE